MILEDYCTLKEFVEIVEKSGKSWPTSITLRSLIRNKDKNGFNKVIIKVAGKVLISKSRFNRWIEEKVKND